ncbi:MAG: serine/threonine-protein kinase [Kofleriaceae bacterium]
MTTTRLGRYELVARLASGGMGEIFLARLEGAEGFQKLFAIKRILPQLANEPRFRKLLIAEARIAARMTHANICQIYELDESEGELFIVLEYLEGATLLPLLRRRARDHAPLDLGFIASVALQTCDALHYAHSLDVIHRDVTLANVFVCESGTAKVLDFGIAKLAHDDATQTASVQGKYAYMAPEQLRGESLDRRADVFALGVVLYEVLALRRLFQRQTDYLTFHAVLELPIPDLRRYRPDVPAAVVAVVMRALERDPDRRFATIRELGSALADAIGPVWPPERVGELVRATFSVARADRKEQLARAATVPAMQAQLAPLDDVPAEDEALVAVEPEPTVPPPLPVTPARGRSRWPWIAISALAVITAVTIVAFALQRAPVPPVIVDKTEPATRASDMTAVNPHMRALADCAAKHPSTYPKATAMMRISVDGTLVATELTPRALADDPLGACLVGVLAHVRFAKRDAESMFSLDIGLPVHR